MISAGLLASSMLVAPAMAQETFFLALGRIILSAGTVDSPKLLMLSGIGDPLQLESHGLVVRNALPGQVSISIHVYGANIGAVKRAIFNPETSEPEYFISGYDNKSVPNLWDLSRSAN